MTYSLQLAQQYGFGTGDRIIVPKSAWNMVQHHALFYGIGQNGHALDGAVKIADGGVTITADGGTVTTGGVATLPPDGQADVPLYPGSKLRVVSTANGAKTVVSTTADPPGKVTAFYKSHLPGWTATMDTTGPDGGIAHRTKGKHVLVITITKSDDGSAGISLVVGPTPP